MYPAHDIVRDAPLPGRRRLLRGITGLAGLGVAPGLCGWTSEAVAALLPPVPAPPPVRASAPTAASAAPVPPSPTPTPTLPAPRPQPTTSPELPPPAPASEAPPASYAAPAPDPWTPQEMKAAYLHKFASYVDWPAGAFPSGQAPLVVAVAGSEDVADALARAARGRPVRGHAVQVMRIARGAVDPATPLHMLFVGREAWKDLPAWVATLRSRPVLLVTDAPRGLEAGAMLAFLQNDGRVRFEAAPRAAERAGLRLGARLLSVAERVQGGTR